MRSFGICIGSSTLSIAEARKTGRGLIRTGHIQSAPHNGNPRQALVDALDTLSLSDGTRIAVTGRKLRHSLRLSSLPEPAAVEIALHHVNGRTNHPDAIISAGGETFLAYVLGMDGKICAVKTGSKCASGTGEFFIQQLRRIGLSLEEGLAFSRNDKPYRVSGRCSVFCKSDCTHATNKGIPKDRIVAGLCDMIACKIVEIVRQIPGSEHIMLIGGLARNHGVVECFRGKVGTVEIPEAAHYFEALGAALWALDHETIPFQNKAPIFLAAGDTFSYHEPLHRFEHLVDWKEMGGGSARDGDSCILGLDVGSTTTKAVLVRIPDDAILYSVYLRTEGNPVEASRACLRSLSDQLGPMAEKIDIAGVGVTGSGRQIAGIYAMTEGVINEIIAHAAGALFFDAAVDTIFEIGGQDAKYTSIQSGVPADYAMNDACSAGTGSFLEEVAREAMGIETEGIGALALAGERPPNFNDQCSAFISSDIKHAFQDGLTREDILAGLIYSVCMNYNNRVKGNRPVGRRIFMQGGVCYNRAVPVAMAALTKRRIVVPPEPGLIGAFGVALEVKRRIHAGMLSRGRFSLKAMKERTVEHLSPFICDGGKEGCDRKCEISRIRIEGRTYPFGGACNRWYNTRSRVRVDSRSLDLVRNYETYLFHDHVPEAERACAGQEGPLVGINKSFLTNTFYPLYRHFFHRAGFRVLLPDAVSADGGDYKGASFCYPAEIAHGFFMNLLNGRPDYLFLPQVKRMSVDGEDGSGITCPISQGEPYYLSTAFGHHEVFARLLKEGKVLRPVLQFAGDCGEAEKAFVAMAPGLGITRKRARAAFGDALSVQGAVTDNLKRQCAAALGEIEADPKRHAIVIVGRTYNAYASDANMGIPQKIASRGVPVLPYSLLPLAGQPVPEEMYWASGKMIMKSMSFIARHPQLFACYISNFSCGPDSFLLEYFRHAMGKKPFLVLELDSHVADAGLETRIEAFLDIIVNYRGLQDGEGQRVVPRPSPVKPARFDPAGQVFVGSDGRVHDWRNPRVHVVIPSMGDLGNRALAAVFRGTGIRATALPPADTETLHLGRGHTSCKECLPFLLTLGSLLQYLRDHKKDGELLVYFMPTASGPCRFGQYSYFIKRLIAEWEIPDVALFSAQGDTSYRNLGSSSFTLKLWSASVLSEILQDLYSLIRTNARDRKEALDLYDETCTSLISAIEASPEFPHLRSAFAESVSRLSAIEPVKPWSDVPTLLLAGEIFVRHDNLSRQFIIDKLAEQGFAVKTAGIIEWIYYTDYCYLHNLASSRAGFFKRPSLALRSFWMRGYERAYKGIVARAGLPELPRVDVGEMVDCARALMNPQLTTEAILTVGGALAEVPHRYCGIISIGPFGCMPSRLSEAILSRAMGRDWHHWVKGGDGHSMKVRERIAELPFLAIESDGTPFPQMITAKMEVFLSQAARLHEVMRDSRC